MSRRRLLADRVAALRETGMIYREIGEALGISTTYAHALVRDPSGDGDRERKRGYAGPCIDCGAPTNGSDGRKAEPRCVPCNNRRVGEERKVWTRDAIVLCIQEWHAVHGEHPSMNDWGNALYTLGDTVRQAQYAAHSAAGEIPHANTVIGEFGSWNAAIVAAGFTPRPCHGGGVNVERRVRFTAARDAA